MPHNHHTHTTPYTIATTIIPICFCRRFIRYSEAGCAVPCIELQSNTHRAMCDLHKEVFSISKENFFSTTAFQLPILDIFTHFLYLFWFLCIFFELFMVVAWLRFHKSSIPFIKLLFISISFDHIKVKFDVIIIVNQFLSLSLSLYLSDHLIFLLNLIFFTS